MAIVIGLLEIFTAFVFFIFFQCLLLHKKTPKPLLTNWPALGMLPGLLLQVPRIYDWITEVLEATDMTFCFKGPCLSGMDILLTVDPVNIHYILSSNFANYPKGMEFKKIFEVVGDSIFNVDSGLWEDMRNSSHAIFSNQDFQMFWVSTSVRKLRQGLVPILENAADKNILVDLQDLFQRFLFDTSLILMTGYDPKCLSVEMPKVEFGDAVDGVSDGVFYRHVKPVFLWRLQYLIGVGVEKRLKRGLAVFDQLLEKIITAKREEINSHGTHHPSRGEAIDVLTYYMTMDTTKYKYLEPSDDRFIKDTILGFLIAARDTTSSALTWFFWLMSKNPEAINKIRQEVNKKMPRFDPADLEKLVYLHGAVCETLRLYPPVPFNHKSPAKPDVLPSGHRVDEKWKIVISMYALGRMKSVWGDDAEDFRPERWISDSGRLKHEPSYKFLAFNAGPRACLGKKLTFLQMKTVAAEIIRNYDIKVVEGHKTEPVPSVLFRMQHGLKVNITRI
ncbi:Similar to cytochrome P450 gb/X90458 from A. thaliana [Arabidopsis thaliana]|uniref:Cytochrome P450, family 96, subfamily A, polypeptide 3 n=1 Tax=Arabidopsis thaliana TaxID=3702 RepID=O80806_ARATH|nr:cytochrome P450, family 96, subfamily A, polypeptide 3 [Arabidopsis thaliana]AAC27155.1 Similar to cytochrome P450 gb/X90458 from A. thaliana [Arabidopsis thaliana]AEE34360.1 cytochrome P450, family 96, subfamily A, polypeptide 3 [Arabidopsis thaliana]|eukprot:NP_176713.1 cytochrome P450, family 96, subfamily A, polypeptide 3 [Arabidopsis thaliana]